MKKSNRFKPIVQVAETRETNAARAVSQAQQDALDKTSRLEQLQGYYQDYAQLFEQQGKSGFDTRQLQSFRAFLSQLNDAIEQQKAQVEISQKIVNEKRQHWHGARKKVKVFEKVVSNFLREEKYLEDKQDQSAMDEHAQNISRRK